MLMAAFECHHRPHVVGRLYSGGPGEFLPALRLKEARKILQRILSTDDLRSYGKQIP